MALLRNIASGLRSLFRKEQVGQELAFHLATNPALYNEFASLLSGQTQPAADGGVADATLAEPILADKAEVVRNMALATGVSPALQAKLARP